MHGRMINITRVLLAESYVATHFSTSLFSRALFLLLHHHRAAAPGAARRPGLAGQNTDTVAAYVTPVLTRLMRGAPG